MVNGDNSYGENCVRNEENEELGSELILRCHAPRISNEI